MAAKEEEQEKEKEGSIITEDPPQLKNPPELGMLLPVVPAGLDPAVVILPSTETDHESTEPTIAPESQLAITVSSKDPSPTKRCLGKQLPMQATKLNKLTSNSFSDLKPAHSQTKNDSTVEDEYEDIHEEISFDPNYIEQSSYNEMFAIMPHFKPLDYWNKEIGVGNVIDIFTFSMEQHKKDNKDDFEWENHKTHPTNKQEIIQAYESVFLFIDGFIPSDKLISQSK